MPELPEVETLRSDLEREILGRRFDQVSVAEHRMTRGQAATEIEQRIQGRAIQRIGRRGKFLLIHLDSDETLWLHRGMSGNLFLQGSINPDVPHLRLSARLDDGRFLALYDPRGFGQLQVITADELHTRCTNLGPEPLGAEFTAPYLARRLGGRVAPIKALLLDQRLIAGLGNIYTDESLWAARLHPGRPAGGLNAVEIDQLTDQIRQVLLDAIEGRGTTFSSARDLYDRGGNQAERLRIFHRTMCPACGGPVQQTRVAGRGTSYCPACQR